MVSSFQEESSRQINFPFLQRFQQFIGAVASAVAQVASSIAQVASQVIPSQLIPTRTTITQVPILSFIPLHFNLNLSFSIFIDFIRDANSQFYFIYYDDILRSTLHTFTIPF